MEDVYYWTEMRDTHVGGGTCAGAMLDLCLDAARWGDGDSSGD